MAEQVKNNGALVWTDEAKELVWDRLKDKGHLRPCSNCSKQAWTLNHGPAWIKIGELNYDAGNSHAHAQLICTNCGEVRLVSLWATKLMGTVEMLRNADGKKNE